MNKNRRDMNKLDSDFTKMVLRPEKKCKRPCEAPWTIRVHQANLVHRFWQTKLSAIANGIDAKEKLQTIRNEVTDPTQLIGEDINQTIRKKRTKLKKARIAAPVERPDFLAFRHDIMVLEGKIKAAVAIKAIANREQRSRCFAKFRRLTKPKHQTGGLSHIIIQTRDENGTVTGTKRIQEQEEMDEILYQRNVQHFAQAEGTPFTLSPTVDLVRYDGNTE